MKTKQLIEALESRIAPAFAGTLQLGLLSGSTGGNPGVRIDGSDGGEHAGFSVADAGDVNGDGFSDLIIGAPDAVVGGKTVGSAYLVFGDDQGFSPTLDLAALGSKGFRIDGQFDGARFGQAVAGVGDVNGDGFDDLAIGAPLANSGSGYSYVIFGKSSFSASFDVSTIDGSNGFRLIGGQTGEFSGGAVAAAGDVNGDGYADIAIGAIGHDITANGNTIATDAGATFVIYGHNGSFSSIIGLSTLGLPSAAQGFRLEGVSDGDGAGGSISAIGDFNGDGFGDFIVGASSSDSQGKTNNGRAYVVFGRAADFPATSSLGGIGGNSGAQIVGINAGDGFGVSAHGAGDVNGDGLADIIVGASNFDANGSSSGEAYVFYGKTGANNGSINATNADLKIRGVDTNDFAGFSVSGIGDFNGDGYDDLIVGAPGVSTNSGASYVVFGRPDHVGTTVELGTLDGTDGFKMPGTFLGYEGGHAVSGAGDFNGDGYADLLIGSPNAGVGGSATGASYVVFGSNGGNAVNIDATGHVATYTDADGDLVTIKVSKGTIDANDFILSGQNYLGGSMLKKIDFANDSDLAKANVTITAKPQMIGGVMHGDGHTTIGDFNADQVNLGVVKIAGELGRVQFSSAKSLTIDAFGKAGLDAQGKASPNNNSVVGVLPKLSVKTNIEGVNILAAKLGNVKIGGDLKDTSIFSDGGTLPAKGPAVALKSLTVGGDMDHSNIFAGKSIFGGDSDVAIGKVLVKGDWIASNLTAGVKAGNDGKLGTGDDELYPGGNATIMSRIASVVIKGQAYGTLEKGGNFAIEAEKIGSVKIGGQKVVLDPMAKDKFIAIGATGDFVVNEIG